MLSKTMKNATHKDLMTILPWLVEQDGEAVLLAASEGATVRSILCRNLKQGDTADACRIEAKEMREEGNTKLHAYIISATWPERCGDTTPGDMAAALRTQFPDAQVLGATEYTVGAPISDAEGNPHGTIGDVYDRSGLAPDPDVNRETVDLACQQATQDVMDRTQGHMQRIRDHYREWTTLVEKVHYGVVDVCEATTDPENLRILARALASNLILRDMSMDQVRGNMGTTVRRLWLDCARAMTGTHRAHALSCYAIGLLVDGDMFEARIALNAARQADPKHSLSSLLISVLGTPNTAIAVDNMLGESRNLTTSVMGTR